MCVLLKMYFLSLCAFLSKCFFSSSKCAVLLKMCEFGQNYIFWQNRCFLWKGYFVQKCVFVKMTILGYFLLHWVMSKCMFFYQNVCVFVKKCSFCQNGHFCQNIRFSLSFLSKYVFLSLCAFLSKCICFVRMSNFGENVRIWSNLHLLGKKFFCCENAILYKCAFLSNDNFVLFSAILCNFVRLCAILTKSAFFVLLFQNVVLPILVLPKFWSFLYLFFLYLRLLFLFILFLSLPSFGLPIFAHPIFVTSYIRSSYFWSSYVCASYICHFLYLVFLFLVFLFSFLPIFVTSYI